MGTLPESMTHPVSTSGDGQPKQPQGPHGTWISEEHGLMVIRDLRMFRRGEEAFCRRLASAIAGQANVRSVRISLDSNTCRIAFAPGRVNTKEIAERFAKAVHEAVLGTPAGSGKEERDSNWGALAAFPAPGAVSLWEIVREAPDRLKAQNAALRLDSSLTRKVAKQLRTQPGVVACRVSFWRRALKITYDPTLLPDLAVIDCSEAILRQNLRLDSEPLADEGAQAVATGPRRFYYLALAGGSFALTVIGLIVPGIPTVPFLLATSYYLARSSPRLNKALSRSRFFGPVLTDLEKSGGLRPINRLKLIGLTLTVSALTLVLAGPSLVLLLIMGTAVSVSIYAINRIPGLPSGTKESPAAGLKPALA